MAFINAGPSSSSTGNTTANMSPSSTTQLPVPQGAFALRLLGMVKSLPVSTVGDPVLMPIINATRWIPTTVVTANANVTMATATVGLYTAAAAGGTAVLTTAALTGQTTNAFAYVRAATAAAASLTAQSLFVNVGVAVATGTVDLYLYGYDISDLPA
jgi:hypothetical protein